MEQIKTNPEGAGPQLRTISTFDVKGPIRKKDHLRVISAHNSLVYAIEKRDREIERLQDQIKALQTQIDETFNIPSASPVVEKMVDALFGEYLKKKQIKIFEEEILPRIYAWTDDLGRVEMEFEKPCWE